HHLFDGDLEREAFVRFLLLGDFVVDLRRHNHAAPGRPGGEGAVEFHAEPLAEFIGVGERAPDARARRMQENGFLDPVRHRDAHYATSRLHNRTAAALLQPFGCVWRQSWGGYCRSAAPTAINRSSRASAARETRCSDGTAGAPGPA